MSIRALWLLIITSVYYFLAPTTSSFAVPPSDKVLEQLKAEGKLQEFIDLDQSARRRGLNQPDEFRLAAGAQAAVIGNLKALVIMVDFSDNPAVGGGSYSDSTHFNHILFSVNSPGVSMNDLYQEMSYGKVTVTGACVGWLRMPQTYAYYVDGQRGFGSYPRNAQKLAEDAIDAAEAAGVDFSLYDSDGDGRVDGLFIVHAGPGYEETGNLNQIHSHAWSIPNTRYYDGITIRSYTMEPEEHGSGAPINVGVFAHEYGHFIGLPDLYDTDYTSAGLGHWDLMASGSYNGGSASPAHTGVWSKMKLGWLTPTRLTSNLLNAQIPQIESDSVAYRVWTDGTVGNQYYLVENRQKVGFDKYLRGDGLMIYHIDDNKSGNTQEWYPGHTASGNYLVAIEQADGLFELERDINSGNGADPWPGSLNKHDFDDLSSPDSKAYNGTTSRVAVWDISASDSLMTANLDVDFSRPRFMYLSHTFTDDGDGDGRPDPGEEASMQIVEFNAWQDVTDVWFSVSTNDSDLVFSDSTAFIGDVLTGDSAINTSDPIVFTVAPDLTPHAVDFYITVTGDGGGYVKTDTVRINIGPDQLLLVDDDAGVGIPTSYDSLYFIPFFDSMRISYTRWEVKTQGPPVGMNSYPMVFWYTGNERSDPVSGPDTTLTPSERAAIASYLDQGGRLFLNGQQIAFMLNAADPDFLHNYLHAEYAGPATDYLAVGVDADVVGDQTLYVLAGSGGAANQRAKDRLTPIGGAVPVFTEDAVPSNITGIRYDGEYRLLFLGWGVEGIGDLVMGLGGKPKDTLLTRAVNWLLYDAVFTGVSLSPLVTNPGQDASHLIDTSIDFHWNYSSPIGAPQDSVQLEVGSDNEWTTAEYWSYGPVFTGDTTVHYGGPTPLPGKTYYWRIRVHSDTSWSTWRTTSFHMNAPPPTPIPSSPVSDQIAVTNGPTLRTNIVTDPDGDACSYEFEVYQDSLLTNLLAAAAGVTGGWPFTSWTVDVLLPENQRAWWRVRASDGIQLSAWSAQKSFYVDGINEAPSAPALIAPLDSAEFFGKDLSLKWGPASDPDLIESLHYRVQIDTLPDFATAATFDSLPVESLWVAALLLESHFYYWNVTTVDKGGLEAASAVRTLHTLLAGDVNADGTVTSADVVFVVNYVFKGGPAPVPAALADVNVDCTVTSADIIYLVAYVFKSGPPPQPGCEAPAAATPPAPSETGSLHHRPTR